jgi:hypothetical protein
MLKLLSRRGYCFNTSSPRLVAEGSPQAQPQLNPLTYVVTQPEIKKQFTFCSLDFDADMELALQQGDHTGSG